MEIAKITSKGQMTVPKAVRDRLALEAGSKVVFLEIGDELVVRNAESVTQRTTENPMEFYRLTPESLPALRRLQEALSGFADTIDDIEGYDTTPQTEDGNP